MVSSSILTNRNLRREIVSRVNKMIDIPYLNERHEAQLLTIVVDMCFNALAGKTMPSTQKKRGIDITNDDPDAAEEEFCVQVPAGQEPSAKEEMIQSINGKLNLPILNEQQEAQLIKYFVDALFQLKDDNTVVTKK